MVDLEKLKTKKRWIKNYIPEFDINKVEWTVLNSLEYSHFLQENYLHDSKPIAIPDIETDELIPLGLTFTTFSVRCDDAKYLISYLPNKKGLKTILTCFRYYENYKVSEYLENVTLASYIETNYFYRGLGLFKLTINKFVEVANINSYVLITPETKEGKMCHTFIYLKEVLSEKGILVFDNVFDINREVKRKKLTKY